MSKIGDNPFGPILTTRADQYGLRPPGSAFPHLEMATVFLAHSVDHYLIDGGLIACVLPDTIRNGTQHLPFRKALSRRGGALPVRIEELWEVEERASRVVATALDVISWCATEPAGTPPSFRIYTNTRRRVLRSAVRAPSEPVVFVDDTDGKSKS